MRKAAIMAGLVPNTREGRARLSFVTEGEASLHFCLQCGLATDAVENGDGILIVDAGGGTIDVSAYKKVSPSGRAYEEFAAPQCTLSCHFQGSIFVTKNAEAYLTEFLLGSSFALDVPIMTQRFDKATKLRFVNPEEPQFIQFGGLRDKDPQLGIRHGQLRLPGTEVAKFFEPSIQCITKSIEDQLDSSEGQISSVFLVGGFAASNWLLTNLKNTFTPRGVNVSRPDSHTNKAVADGAVSFCIDHFVQARVAKYSYGICMNTSYNSRNTEHIARGKGVFVGLDGYPRIRGAFDVILPKTAKISETQEFRRSYRLQDTDQANLRTMSTSIKCFRGTRRDPRWMDEEAALYSTLCDVEADLSNLPLKAKHSIVTNETYYEAHYDVVLSLGLTEFKAFVVWKENGVEKRSPAEMVYDPELLITDDEALI
ncbi:hypothetical protein NLJ89_g2175 [Agrocybe chaxingu]|uniref:Uncharacterized protein n=1 Tax=Agrocybe chaxingu TaxID=84603 RepID=A0A9W8MY90_9AGAR|nr:hypothetical protein NLJ89_g2175 [Agrocybe chaxingu]